MNLFIYGQGEIKYDEFQYIYDKYINYLKLINVFCDDVTIYTSLNKGIEEMAGIFAHRNNIKIVSVPCKWDKYHHPINTTHNRYGDIVDKCDYFLFINKDNSSLSSDITNLITKHNNKVITIATSEGGNVFLNNIINFSSALYQNCNSFDLYNYQYVFNLDDKSFYIMDNQSLIYVLGEYDELNSICSYNIYNYDKFGRNDIGENSFSLPFFNDRDVIRRYVEPDLIEALNKGKSL